MNVLSVGKNKDLFMRCSVYDRLDFLKILAESNKEYWIDAFMHACSINHFSIVKWFLDDAQIDRKLLLDRREVIQTIVFNRGTVELIQMLDKELNFIAPASEFNINDIIIIGIRNNRETARWIAQRTGTPDLWRNVTDHCRGSIAIVIAFIGLFSLVIYAVVSH